MLDALPTLAELSPPPGGKSEANVVTPWRRLLDVVGGLIITAREETCDLDTAVDVVVGSDEYAQADKEYRAKVPRLTWRPLKVENRFPRAVFFHDVISRNLRKGVEIANTSSKALASVGPDTVKPSIPEDERTSPLWFLNDPSLPSIVVRGLLGVRRAELEFLLIHYLATPLIRNAEMLREATTLWVRDLQTHALFVASLPGARMPARMIRESDRRTLVDEVARQAKRLDVMKTIG